MREIDLDTWRRRHFERFNSFVHPHFSMCVNLGKGTGDERSP